MTALRIKLISAHLILFVATCNADTAPSSKETSRPRAQIRVTLNEYAKNLSLIAYIGRNCNEPRNQEIDYATWNDRRSPVYKYNERPQFSVPAGVPMALEIRVTESVRNPLLRRPPCIAGMTFTPEADQHYDVDFSATSESCVLKLYQAVEPSDSTRARTDVRNVEYNSEKCLQRIQR